MAGTDCAIMRKSLLQSINPCFRIPSYNRHLATYCGLTIDANTKVLDVYEEPIRDYTQPVRL